MNRIGDSLFHTGANRPLIEALVAAEAQFVLVGGLAVAWYCPDREADDMDLLVDPAIENSRRIARVLHSLHLNGFEDDSFARAGLQVLLKSNLYAELLTPQADGPSYTEVAGSAVDGRLFNIAVRIASPQALILLKQRAIAAGADVRKHEEDIRRLRERAV